MSENRSVGGLYVNAQRQKRSVAAPGAEEMLGVAAFLSPPRGG